VIRYAFSSSESATKKAPDSHGVAAQATSPRGRGDAPRPRGIRRAEEQRRAERRRARGPPLALLERHVAPPAGKASLPSDKDVRNWEADLTNT